MVKNPPANAGHTRDVGSIPGWGRSPGVGKWQPTLVYLPGKFHGQRSLVGYSQRSHRESDTTGQLSKVTEAASIKQHFSIRYSMLSY